MNFPSKKIMPRFFGVGILLVLASIAVVCKALYIMTVEHQGWMEERDMARENKQTTDPKRGSILDCNGRVLATSMPQYLVTIDFCTYEKDSLQRVKDQYRRDTLYQNNADEICEGMHRLFPDINPKKYRAYLDSCQKKHARACPLYPPQVTSITMPRGQKRNKQLTYLELCEVRKLPLFNKRSSLGVNEVKMRRTPYGSLAYRTVGSYKDSARFGLELSYDSVLAGRPGHYHFEKVRNERIKVIDEPVEDGLDVMTTLDVDMQDLCKQVLNDELIRLKADSGVCILMEVATGDVKAIVSLQDKEGNGDYIEHNPHAITSMFMPGSIFKPCSFMIAMDDGRVGYNDAVDCQGGVVHFGTRIKDTHQYIGASGKNTVREIIKESLNTGTAIFIYNHYKNDPQNFVNGINRVGMAMNLEVPIEGYRSPYIASPNDKRRYWTTNMDLPLMSIGYCVQIPPINIVSFYAGIANGGRMMYPRFVKGFMKEGQMVQEVAPRVAREQMAKPEVIANLQDALRAVVSDGTAHAAGSKLVKFSGKTGTAQVYHNGRKIPNYYSISFVGYFPSEQPRYALLLNMQMHRGYGNMCAVGFRQIAEQLMAKENGQTQSPPPAQNMTNMPHIQNGNLITTSRALNQLGIRYSKNCNLQTKDPVWGKSESINNQAHLQSSSSPKGIVPDVTGYGLRDAVYRLECMGLKVQVKGQGSVVQQSLPYGHKIKPGETIILTLRNS